MILKPRRDPQYLSSYNSDAHAVASMTSAVILHYSLRLLKFPSWPLLCRATLFRVNGVQTTGGSEHGVPTNMAQLATYVCLCKHLIYGSYTFAGTKSSDELSGFIRPPMLNLLGSRGIASPVIGSLQSQPATQLFATAVNDFYGNDRVLDVFLENK